MIAISSTYAVDSAASCALTMPDATASPAQPETAAFCQHLRTHQDAASAALTATARNSGSWRSNLPEVKAARDQLAADAVNAPPPLRQPVNDQVERLDKLRTRVRAGKKMDRGAFTAARTDLEATRTTGS